MGDIKYPGIVFIRANPSVQVNQVKDFLTRSFRNEPFKYMCGLEPTVKIYNVNHSRSTVVIGGILESLDCVREKIGTRMIAGYQAWIQGGDFGVERKENGDMTFNNLQRHNHLKEGQGNLGVINIFNESFNREFGSLEDHKATVLYNAPRECIIVNEMKKAGKWFLYGSTTRPGETSNFNATEINYGTKIESLQCVCLNNRNAKFSQRKEAFITGVEDGTAVLCKISKNFGLGIAGSILRIRDLIRIYGYIPFSVMNQSKLALDKLDMLSGFCDDCYTFYQIQGIATNMAWLAGKCECSQSIHWWNTENFTRLFLKGNERKAFNTSNPSDRRAKKYKLIRLIPGLLPKYESIEHFRKTVFGAYTMDFNCQMREMHYNQTMGSVKSCKKIETYLKNAKPITRYLIRILVGKDKLWSREGLLKIASVDLIPLFDQESIEAYAKSKISMQDAAELNPKNANVYDIEDCSDEKNMVVLSIVLESTKQPELHEDSKVVVIPKCSKREYYAIEKAISKWEESEHSTRYQTSKVLDTNVIDVKQVTGKTERVWQVLCCVPYDSFWSLTKETLLPQGDYVGIDILLGNYLPSFGIGKGRIYNVEIGGFEQVTIFCILILPSTVAIDETKNLSLSFWILTNDLEQVARMPESPFAKMFYDTDYCQKSKSTLQQDSVDIGSLVKGWQKKPTPVYSILEWFLASSGDNIDTRIERSVNPSARYISCIEKLRKDLDCWQLESIDKMLNNTLSVVHGPPGSGKSSTAGHGVANLFCREHGLIVVCCPSNYAAQVLEGKINDVNSKFNVGMRVVRMLSTSQENLKDGRRTAKDNSRLLHELVQSHPLWKSDKTIVDIIEKELSQGTANLFKEERDRLDAHKLEITRQIFMETDVLVCTVGTSNDGRLQMCLDLMVKNGKTISGLVLDEASLQSVPSTIPLLTYNFGRIWILGDDAQLRPQVHDPSALNACLDISYMEFLRLMNVVKERNLVTLLRIQYRMASPIARLVSKFMYDGELESSLIVQSRDYSNRKILENFPELRQCNMACYTYGGYGEENMQDSFSAYNTKEVDITRDLLCKLENANVDFGNVCVITMYDLQVSALKKMVAKLGAPYTSVEVSSVDAYQGKENSVVILNTVKSNKDHLVGFLREKRRLNVAISRPKDYLMIVGDLKTLSLSEIPDLDTLLQLLDEESCPVVEYTKNSGTLIAKPKASTTLAFQARQRLMNPNKFYGCL